MKVRKEIRDTLKGRTLFLLGNWTGHRVGVLPSEVSGQLQVSDLSAWETDGNLSFLTTAVGVTDLKLVSHKKVDLTPLSSLGGITNLVLRLPQNVSQGFDFESLPELETLDADWNAGFRGLWQHPTIKCLTLDGIKRIKAIDVSSMKQLKQLSIRNSVSVESLDLGDLNLDKLSLLSLPKLSKVLGQVFFESVTHLSVTRLKGIDAKWFRAFRALRIIEVGMKDQITKAEFDCSPDQFVRMP
jgi:hypothetical protein